MLQDERQAANRGELHSSRFGNHPTLAVELPNTELVFEAGVSTAAKVTDISGRGVGMDVVRREIDAAGGRVTIKTEVGAGTHFGIELPRSVSTQFLEGFVIRQGDESYILPLLRVEESFPIDRKEVVDAADGLRCVRRQGEIVALVDLADLFHQAGEGRSELDGRIAVAVECGRHRVALLVDDVIGVQQVVVKELDGLQLGGGLFSGCAIMGDGQIAMVLDIKALTLANTARVMRRPTPAKAPPPAEGVEPGAAAAANGPPDTTA